jgi:hypothetical protein
MNRHSQIATWFGATLGTVCALVMLAVGAHGSDYRGAVTEEFHQTYSLTPDGRVELDNINGPVHISTWDRNEVKVDAIKSASTKERLDEARIEIVMFPFAQNTATAIKPGTTTTGTTIRRASNTQSPFRVGRIWTRSS